MPFKSENTRPPSAAARVVSVLAALTVVGTAPLLAQRKLLSPRDSTHIVIDGLRIEVNYGRPSMRGRKIFGGLVPWNRVWRTGANAATGFATSTDLRVGGAEVAAGNYTLYTIPAEDGWTLIISRETGQWGTVYHPKMDLTRIPMRLQSLEQPVEQFTISLSASDESTAVLSLEWERTRAWVPIELER